MRVAHIQTFSFKRYFWVAALASAPLFFTPTVSAANTAEPCHCTSGVSAQQTGSVTVYRGPSISYDYAASNRARLQQETARKSAKAQRVQKIQALKIAKLEGKVEALETRKAEAEPKRRGRYGRKYYGNSAFFGSNGFIGNSNFSGATVQLQGGGRRNSNKTNRVTSKVGS